ncbi:hypothetical protein FB45DRAFT_329138 [Roridomyces roridus]|uniref:Uncharacterized protein n=1 Tax=Roridomyces roridus TaxID=1738132 RepID=A0AAD7B540_9AGAR|nr:hypothetical protein FB45DRAFT_329138 [Roridomyces roridus]
MSSTNYVTKLNNYYQTLQASHTVSWPDFQSGLSHQPQWTVQCKVSGDVKGAQDYFCGLCNIFDRPPRKELELPPQRLQPRKQLREMLVWLWV